METSKRDSNVKHLSYISVALFVVGFLTLWMYLSTLDSLFVRQQNEANAAVMNSMNKQAKAVKVKVAEPVESSPSSPSVAGTSKFVDDSSMGDSLKDLENVDLTTIEQEYR
jgi:hypothetical protein